MCGIVGYVGEGDCTPVLLDGLRRFEHRGCDTAGMVVITGGGGGEPAIRVVCTQSEFGALRDLAHEGQVEGQVGLGYARWAFQGCSPVDGSVHPRVVGRVAVVHNGVVENYLELRGELIARGHSLESEADAEIFARLINEKLGDGVGLEQAMSQALGHIQGAYAIAAVNLDEPDRIVCARSGFPLVIGLGEGENYLASEVSPILNFTKKVLYLEEGEVAVLTKGDVSLQNREGERVDRHYREVTWSPAQAEKGGYKHYMLKEILEQPGAIVDTFRGRVLPASGKINLDGIQFCPDKAARLKRIIVIACGTSYYAGMTGRFFLESMAGVPVQVELASEFRYREPLIDQNDLVLAISQSGETGDTLVALREVKAKGGTVLSICNVMGSSIPSLSDGVLYTHAGPEIGVASTKAFTCQVAGLHLLSLYLGQLTGNLTLEQGRRYIKDLLEIPVKMGQVLERLENTIREVAWAYYQYHNFLYLGRGNNFPIALEGALKLKETSYIHGEGYAAGELKHGPIALIDEEMPVVVIAPQDQYYQRTINNLEEVKAKGGRILALGTDGDERIAQSSDHVIYLPPVPNHLSPLVTVLPLQLLAYHIADLKGTDVDQPRNLAKSVTE